MNIENKDFEKIISDIPLPACPSVLLEIDSLISQPHFQFSELSTLIKKDVALSAGLIKIANSPLYSLNQNTSIQTALQMIGERNVAFYARAFLLLAATSQGESTIRFWDSSWRIAEMSAHLAQQLHKAKFDEMFTFGLFRDVGIAVLMSNYSNYKDILSQANQERNHAFTFHEDREYGINHAQIGAFIAADWNLPDYFVAAIHYHHTPEELDTMALSAADYTRAMEMMAIAQLAEYAIQQQTGLSQTYEWEKLQEVCMNTLALTAADIDILFKHALQTSW